MDYQDFLEHKIKTSPLSGFQVERDEINPMVFEFQKDTIIWGLLGGKRALFSSFGLGKTFCQLEMARLTLKKKGGKALIICPLGVKQEFTEDGKKLGIQITYVKSNSDIINSPNPIMITNYERVRDGGIDVDQFIFVTLDEASVLRSYGSKTYQEFLPMFESIPYRFVCTATPSPNKFKELIHYAGFLGIMDTGQALTRFFARNSQKANDLTLYPHKEEEFWLWMSTWALFVTKPSDLGYSDEGYDLPPMNMHYHCVTVDHSLAQDELDGQKKMFRDSAMGLAEASREKRLTLDDRIDKMTDILVSEDLDKHWIIWHDLEDERRAIKKAIPETVEVYGSQDIDTKEQNIIKFSNGEIKILATKPKISGSGCNFQRYCSDMIFLGVGYKFNDFIQAIHRCYRFLQKNEVNVHVIYAESEESILKVLLEKWAQHVELVENMTRIIKLYGLTQNAMESLKRTIGSDRVEVSGTFYTAINNDCVVETASMEENSVDLIHTSIPFGNQYEYSPSYNDFGHNEDNEQFFVQMDFLVPNLLRILKPGRVAAIHVKDRILFGNATGLGMPSVDPFSDMTVAAFRKHGFIFFGRITVVTDVVRENNQTYRLGWTENSKDGSKMGCGMNEYILLFRKLPSDTSKAYADEPVHKSKEVYTRAHWQVDASGFWRSSGDRFLSTEEIKSLPIEKVQRYFEDFSRNSLYNYHEHIRVGQVMEDAGKLPATYMSIAPVSTDDDVWTDIIRMRTLNSKQTQKKLQNHVCPLQLDIVERVIGRFSNEGEVVLDPFGGLMTVPYMALKMKRRGCGIELNADYFRDGLFYLRKIECELTAPTLFDLDEIA